MIAAPVAIWIAVEPMDMRVGIDGLSLRVQQALGRSPCDGSAYVFRNRRGDRLKVLLWDGNGVWLCQRRLHQGRFYAAARIAAQFGRTICIPWDDPEACREQNAAQRAYQLKYGILHLLSTALPDPALGLYHFLSLYRADPARPWTEAARQLKERLFPHLIEAFMQARCLHMKKERGAAQGYAIADRTLSIANVTPLFRELVMLEWPHWNGDQMPPEVRAVWSHGKRLYYRGKQVVISMEPDQQLVHLMARRCNALDLLSARELAVARLFARGLEHKDVAKEAGVSPHTVRNQIKTIYTKLGVSSKTELVAYLADLS